MPHPIVFVGAMPAAFQALPSTPCTYCTRPGGCFPGGSPGRPACALCHLPHHLARPEIDAEGSLIWLPELDQALLNVMVREMHMQLAGMNEPLRDGVRPVAETPARERIYHVRMALLGRAAAIQARIGTSKPRELGQALRQMVRTDTGQQADLLGGLRLLPTGQFFEDGRDVYPAIVAGWREAATTQPGA